MTIAVLRRNPTSNLTMDGSGSSIGSRATAIKSTLLAAWRGKLSNEDWESNIRKVLPPGVNGDVYDLADCLLKQALIGPVPNQLFLNYLKHAVSCKLVSHGAVLSSISNQPINLRITTTMLQRTSPIICLLEFLKSFRDKIYCDGSEVECLNLCHSLSGLIHWLLKCIQLTLEFIVANPPANLNSQQHQGFVGSSNPMAATTTAGQHVNSIGNSTQIDTLMSILDLCNGTINYFVKRPFTKSLLFVSKMEFANEFNENIIKLVYTIIQQLSSSTQLQSFKDKVHHLGSLRELSITFDSRELHPSVVAAKQLECLKSNRIRSTQNLSSINRFQASQIDNSDMNKSVFNCLYPLIAFDAVLRPARPVRFLAHQIVTITGFISVPIYITYCELIRICLIGFYDAHGKAKAKITWSFFTFLKLPRLLIQLNRLYSRQQTKQRQQHLQATGEAIVATNFITDLKQALDRLCTYSPLLDEAEHRCNCDLFKCLVKELIKNDPSLLPLKSVDFKRHPARRPINTPNNTNPAGGHMISKTEPVVTHMLDTLESEQDPIELLGVLCQSCLGVSLEYTISAAAATGRLHIFVKRLIEHNELYKHPKESPSRRHSQAQALNFDITFLILIYVAQRYGSELIERSSSVTFNKWYYEFYDQETCSSCPREMVKNFDDAVVSDIIKQLLEPEEDVHLENVNWSAICFNTPKAISEILNAWEQQELSDSDIMQVIERLRSRMCFMAVVSSHWLQCYIKTLDENSRSKPVFILTNLSKPSPLAKQQKISNDIKSERDLKTWGYLERCSLMGAIVKRILFELAPSKVSVPSSSTNSLAKQTSLLYSMSAVTTTNTTTSTSSSTPSTACEFEDAQVCNGNNSVTSSSSNNNNNVPYHSYKDRFISTLTTKEIFSANIKSCLREGSTDYSALNSISSLFKMVGSHCFANLMVDEIMTGLESPSDLSRAVNISFGMFHLDIEACAFALLDNIIPEWLMSEKKQILLNQPRAFALADLATKTIIEVYINLKAALSSSISSESNGKQLEGDGFSLDKLGAETGYGKRAGLLDGPSGTLAEPCIETSSNSMKLPSGASSAGSESVSGTKRIKLEQKQQQQQQQQQRQQQAHGFEKNFGLATNSFGKGSVRERLNKLNLSIANLMQLFKEIMSEPVISHRTLFPVLFLQQTIVCARESSTIITVHLNPDILLDIIDRFSSELTFELVLAMSNVSSTHCRKYAAKSICKLAQLLSANSGGGGGGGAGQAAAIATAQSSASSTAGGGVFKPVAVGGGGGTLATSTPALLAHGSTGPHTTSSATATPMMVDQPPSSAPLNRQ